MQNVTGTDLSTKQNAFIAYAAHDAYVDCSSVSTCNTEDANWLQRQYTIPFANAGPDRTVSTGATVQLDGLASFDAVYPSPPATYTYAWTQIGTPSVSLSGANTATPTFTAPASATSLTFQLTVTSGALSDSDTVTITVAADMTNIAGQATVTGLSDVPSQPATDAVDGFTDGNPLGDASHEWANARGQDW